MTTKPPQDALQDLVRMSEDMGLYEVEFAKHKESNMKELANHRLDEITIGNPVTRWFERPELLRDFARAAIAADRALNAPADRDVMRPTVTDEMVAAYLTANDNYWREKDALPPSQVKWRNGTPSEATRISLEAALAASPTPPAEQPIDRDSREAAMNDRLLAIIANTYQILGALDAPAHILDVLSDPIGATDAQLEAMLPFVTEPIDMVLHCPACGKQHVDREEITMVDRGPNSPPGNYTSWTNPPHRSHLCHACGHIWRPADVPTNGVAAVKTKGKNDSRTLPHSMGLHPRTIDLIGRFSVALSAKLLKAQLKYGYSDGWSSKDWMDECRAKLMQHIIKGDPLDVAAYCAFLWHHGERTALVAEQQVAQEPVAWMTPGGDVTRSKVFADEQSALSFGQQRPTPLYTHPSPTLAELRAKVEALTTFTADHYTFDAETFKQKVLAEIDKMGGKV